MFSATYSVVVSLAIVLISNTLRRLSRSERYTGDKRTSGRSAWFAAIFVLDKCILGPAPPMPEDATEVRAGTSSSQILFAFFSAQKRRFGIVPLNAHGRHDKGAITDRICAELQTMPRIMGFRMVRLLSVRCHP